MNWLRNWQLARAAKRDFSKNSGFRIMLARIDSLILSAARRIAWLRKKDDFQAMMRKFAGISVLISIFHLAMEYFVFHRPFRIAFFLIILIFSLPISLNLKSQLSTMNYLIFLAIMSIIANIQSYFWDDAILLQAIWSLILPAIAMLLARRSQMGDLLQAG